MPDKFIVIACACAFFLLSCGETAFEKDGRKMARLICKEQQLSAKVASGDEAAKKELLTVQNERANLKEELSVKYKDDVGNEEMRRQAKEITDEEMANCK